jgi:hypothetical protein
LNAWILIIYVFFPSNAPGNKHIPDPRMLSEPPFPKDNLSERGVQDDLGIERGTALFLNPNPCGFERREREIKNFSGAATPGSFNFS